MGHYLVNAVFHGLNGKELPPLEKKSASGKVKILNFNANSIALLAAVANGQPNPGTHGVIDTIFCLNAENMCKLTHFGTSCLAETRDYLVSNKLLSYWPKLIHEEVYGSGRMKPYSYVYQINVQTIRKLNADVNDGYWEEKILVVRDDKEHRLTNAQRRALCLPPRLANGQIDRHADSSDRNADSPIRDADSPIRIADTNRKRQNKKQNNNTTTVAVEPFGGRDSDEFQSLIKRMATDFGVDEKAIDQKLIWDNVKNRDPQAVDEAIDEFAEKVEIEGLNKRKQPGEILGLFVKLKLKPIPELPPEKRKEAVEKYTIRPTPAQKKQNDLAELRTNAWKEVITVLHLDGLQDKACNAIRGKLDSLLAEHDDSREREEILQMLKKNVRYDIGKAGGDIMTAMPKPEDRVKFLEDIINGICNQVGGG